VLEDKNEDRENCNNKELNFWEAVGCWITGEKRIGIVKWIRKERVK